MADVKDYSCIYFEQGVCGHPELVGTDDWPGEVSPNYCSRCKLREYFDDRTYGAEVANDCY